MNQRLTSEENIRKLCIVPINLRMANEFIRDHHRHSKPTRHNGGKFAIGVSDGVEMHGVAIVGNPISASYMDGFTAEVLRCCVAQAAPKNCCSKLYSRCWQIWRMMGGKKMITYTLQTESGASLRGAGWVILGETKAIPPGWNKNDHLNGSRHWVPVMGQKKFRWGAK